MKKEAADDGRLSMAYNFNGKEIAALARLFRKRQDCIPSELADFAAAIERAVYGSMSIEEVQRLYL